MPEQRKSVFVSMGNPYRDEYEALLTRLMDLIEDAGLRPRVINRTDYPIGRPLEHISAVLSECSGAVIVAFERSYFPSGTEKRGSPRSTEIREGRYTTPWNHIEAALAYKQGLPLLVLAEDGVRQEGLIEEGHDWYVERFTATNDALSGKDVRARLSEWFRSVRDRRPAAKATTGYSGDSKLSDIVMGMSVKALWALAALSGAGLAAAFGAGVKIGRLFPG